MNTRSLEFRLIGWYAGLLFGLFGVLGVSTYWVLRTSLAGSLRENQLRRARQIGQLLREEIERRDEGGVGAQVQARYAPDLNDRFVRIARQDGGLVYLSPGPRSQSFDPAALPPPEWTGEEERAREVPLLGGRRMLLAGHPVKMPGSGLYLVEVGAPMDEVQADLRHWLVFLLAMLPVVGAIALGGGYALVKRALAPVDRISRSAERISSHNLSERLPVPDTGDELERLSVALNHMIERLDEAFQQSRRFVADASHELRTPLTVVRGELESFVTGEGLSAEWRERLGSALEEVDRLASIVEGLFAISRLDAGEAASEWVTFDLGRLVASTAEQMGLLAEDKKIQVACTGSKDVWVRGDRARMKQVVVNLLDNAIKYTPEGGAVSLKVEAGNGKAILEVADNGPGIPAEALTRVFERFFRVDKARSRQEGGAGLGLSIVKSICAAHHGGVEVTSEPGRGSRFRVELPCARPNAGSDPDENGP
ncbi:MAG: sensor histidine kinase [Limisphaerales bacterium]